MSALIDELIITWFMICIIYVTQKSISTPSCRNVLILLWCVEFFFCDTFSIRNNASTSLKSKQFLVPFKTIGKNKNKKF